MTVTALTEIRVELKSSRQTGSCAKRRCQLTNVNPPAPAWNWSIDWKDVRAMNQIGYSRTTVIRASTP